jgi:folate-binding protein YgfZ
MVSRLALGLRVEAHALTALKEGEWRSAGEPASSIRVERTEEVWPEAYSLMGPADAITSLWRALVEAGARPSGNAVWSTLRVEAGRPVFGTDMDTETIPTEAGIDLRAIDHTKGCYTGQEVIVRIRDRGHVNRRLRRLELGDVPTPVAGTELTATDGSGKTVGRITSAVQSPKYGGVLALAYVGRGVDRVLLEGREVPVPP